MHSCQFYVRRFSFALCAASLFVLVCLQLTACVGSSSENGVAVRLGENPVVYVKRVTPRDEDDGSVLPLDLSNPVAFYPGASLRYRAVASPRAEERNITAGMFDGAIDVKDVSASYDGRRILFALRAPEIEDADEEDQPTWNIWEYDFDLKKSRRIIPLDLVAEEGHDMAPRYLPDGRILFASTRQRQALARLLDEGKPQFPPLEEGRRNTAVALHVMNADGTGIRQISFNPSHDLWPLVLQNGRVMWLRWDNKEAVNEFNFYSARPDGAATGIMYGADSHVQLDPAPIWSQPRLLEDGSVLVMRRPPVSASWSGVPVRLRVQDFINADQPLGMASGNAESGVLPLPLSASGDEVSPGGRVAAMAPLNDGTGRYLMAWSPCRIQLPGVAGALPCTAENLGNPQAQEASPAYGLWIFDGAAQLPVVMPEAGTMITDVAVLASRSLPAVLADGEAGVDRDLVLAELGAGVLDIRSVYDFAGEFQPLVTPPAGVTTLEDFRDPSLVRADQRRARFMRIIKGVLIPDDDVVELDGADFGQPLFGMRELVGYVPVAPDGSVRAVVPAGVPLSIELVDRDGRRLLSRHSSWLSVMPGETLQCGGCHAAGSSVPHGRPDAEPASINAGAPATGVGFPNSNPALYADAGETMAQVLARIVPESEYPQLDLVFDDVWSEPASPTLDPSWSILYADLATPSPALSSCTVTWSSLCRAIIHYVEHIQPIWEAPREVDEGGSLVDVTCTSCHTRRDAANALVVPAAQLELTGEPDGVVADNLVSYRELLFQDNALVLEDGALVDALVPLLDDQGNPVYQLDELGEPVLDELGNPVPVLVADPVTPPMVAGSASASRFFSRFADGGAHPGWLTAAERKLLSEWLDMGGQYYNDPFAVPQ